MSLRGCPVNTQAVLINSTCTCPGRPHMNQYFVPQTEGELVTHYKWKAVLAGMLMTIINTVTLLLRCWVIKSDQLFSYLIN